MAAQTNAADVKAQLAETLGRCRATLSQTEKTLERLEDEVPPDGCIVPVVHTPDCMFESIARLARLDANATFLDLGCGDGRVVDGVCKIAGCRGIGVDIRMECVEAARERYSERVFHQADFCAMVAGTGPPPTGLEGVDACYAHLLPTTFAVLDARLLAAVQRGLRLVTFCSHPSGAAWDACQTGSDCFGMVRLYEASDDPTRGRLPGGVGAVLRAAASSSSGGGDVS